MEYLFVYGTLQSHFKNQFSEFLHANASFISTGYFYGSLFKIDYYPGAILNESSNYKVFGSIYLMHEPYTVLKKLDAYEEVGNEFEWPNEYVRTKVNVMASDTNKYECWVYLYNKETSLLERIETGVFLPEQ